MTCQAQNNSDSEAVRVLSTLRGSWTLLSRLEKLKLSLLIVARVVSNGLDIIGLLLLGAVGAIALTAQASLPVIGDLHASGEKTVLWLLLVAGASFFSKTLLSVWLSRTIAFFLARIESDFSDEITRQTFSDSLSELKRKSVSDIEWAILRSTDIAISKVMNGGISIIAEATLAIGIFAVLAVTNWFVAITTTLYFMLVLVLFQLFSTRAIAAAGIAFTENSIRVSNLISSLTAAFREITVARRASFFYTAISEARARVAKAAAVNFYLAAIPRSIAELALIVGVLVVFGVQFLTETGASDLADIGVLIVGSLRIMTALLPLQRGYMSLRYQAAGANASQKLLRDIRGNSKLEPESAPIGLDSLVVDGGVAAEGLAVSVRNVSFTYPDGRTGTPALNRVSLEIAAGETVALIGPSGAGKSTLVDLILGLHAPSSGSVELRALSGSPSRSDRPGSIGYVPQRPGLISGTIRENVALGVPAHEISEERIWDALAAAELTEYVEHLAHGLSTTVGDQRDGFSGGQIQRLGVARALYWRPQLLVLDEPTSSLDSITASQVMGNLSAITYQPTMIIVAHNMSTISTLQNIYLLNSGQVVAHGSFKQLAGTYREMEKFLS